MPKAALISWLGMLLAPGAMAQMVLHTGTVLQVNPGTSLRVAGSSEMIWVFNAGSDCQNDGEIVLAPTVQLAEEEGAAIIGTGTEWYTSVPLAAVSNYNAGGLGLVLSTTEAVGIVQVQRGHSPRLGDGGVQGIARWYFAQASAGAPASGIRMTYDAEELNGLAEDLLGLYTSADGIAAWNEVGSIVLPSENTVVSTDVQPLQYHTLFANTGTTLERADVGAIFQVYPTPTTGRTTLLVPGSGTHTLVVHDHLARTLYQRQVLAGAPQPLDLSHLSTGAYLLHVQGFLPLSLLKQ
jgi:hypothetical protein